MRGNRLGLRLVVAAILMCFAVVMQAEKSPMCLTARDGRVTVTFDIKGVTPSTIEYSTDMATWRACTVSTIVTLNADESVYFRAVSDQTTSTAVAFGANDSANSSHFAFASVNGGTVEGSGNIMSLYGPGCPHIQLPSEAFANMFYGCTLLTKAPELPATVLAYYCYAKMFEGCTSLVTAPVLPAMTLAYYCYAGMFKGCTALSRAPALPARVMAYECYYGMFTGCVSLATAPVLPAMTLSEGCYDNMFEGCTALRAGPALPAVTMADYCYNDMFRNCTSLSSAPALPATTLASHCYAGMFSGCTALGTAPSLPAMTMAEYCYQTMFADCVSLRTAPELPARAMADYCYQSMFLDCQAIKIAPELPATTLADGCYNSMFYGCTGLRSVPDLPATVLSDMCYSFMFQSCNLLIMNSAPPGTVWRLNVTSTGTNSLDGMFNGTGGTMNGTPAANTTYYIFAYDSVCHDTICLGEPYNNYGFSISDTDITVGNNTFARTKMAVSVDDPDTIVTLLLNVPLTHHETYAKICSGDTYWFGGQDLTEAGDYMNIGVSAYGCADTMTLHLAVNEVYDLYEHVIINQGESCYGYSIPGDYRVMMKSTEGCDSVVNLHLTVIDNTNGVDETGMEEVSVVSEDGRIVVRGAEGRGVRVYDAVGRMVASTSDAGNTEVIDVPTKGVYYVRIGDVWSVKIIVR